MKIRTAVVGVMMLTLAMVVGQGCQSADMKREKLDMEKMKAMTQSVYVCPECHVMALEAGQCSMCGKDLQEMHLLGIKNGKALLCSCPAGCKCDAAGMKDGKCACGKEVKKMSAKGMYVCPKGCPEISAKPGVCLCGEKMKKVK
jgi:hypothetical protein